MKFFLLITNTSLTDIVATTSSLRLVLLYSPYSKLHFFICIKITFNPFKNATQFMKGFFIDDIHTCSGTTDTPFFLRASSFSQNLQDVKYLTKNSIYAIIYIYYYTYYNVILLARGISFFYIGGKWNGT